MRKMCGVFGVADHAEAANIAYLGMHALQHRGQESAGMVSVDDAGRFYSDRRMGRVGEVFTPEALARLPGRMVIGHVRYSTAGGSGLENAQPFVVSYRHGQVAVGHNGNLTNAEALRDKLEHEGSIFRSTSDTEVIVQLLARAPHPELADRIAWVLPQLEGAFSLVFLAEHELIAARDQNGFRPLCIGRMGEAHVVASESCAFDLLGARVEREVAPGEMVVISRLFSGQTASYALSSRRFQPDVQPPPRRACVFEHVYFARPDSFIDQRSVYQSRLQMGRLLAREHATSADVVIPVPDSGIAAAIGYAQESGIDYALGLVRSHYVGRTFIEPQQSIRHFGVKLKLAPVRAALEGKRVVVVDDSIVRGTTSRKIVKMIREAGAKEVHLRISSPPTTHPCYFGIDTPTRAELLASSHTLEEMRTFVTSDSLAFLSREGLLRAVGASGKADSGFCDACFTGNYPIRLGPGRTGEVERPTLQVVPAS